MPHTRFKLLVQVDQAQPSEVTYASPEYRAQVASGLIAGELFQTPGKASVKPLALGFVNETDAFVKAFGGALHATGPKPASFPRAGQGLRYLMAIHFESRSVSVEDFTDQGERYAKAEVVARESQLVGRGKIARVTLLDIAVMSIADGATVNTDLVPGLRSSAVTPTLVAADDEDADETDGDADTAAQPAQAEARAPAKTAAAPATTQKRRGRKASTPAEPVVQPTPKAPQENRPKIGKRAQRKSRRPQRPPALVNKSLTDVEVPIQNAWRLVAAATGMSMSTILNHALEQLIGRTQITADEMLFAQPRSKGAYEDNLAAYRQVVAAVAALDKATATAGANGCRRHKRPPAEANKSLTDVEVQIQKAWRLLAAATGLNMSTILNDALEQYIGRRELTADELAVAQPRCQGHYENYVAAHRGIVLTLVNLGEEARA